MSVFACVCVYLSVCVCVCVRACVCARVLENGRNVLSGACLSQGFVGMARHVFILKMESREERKRGFKSKRISLCARATERIHSYMGTLGLDKAHMLGKYFLESKH